MEAKIDGDTALYLEGRIDEALQQSVEIMKHARVQIHFCRGRQKLMEIQLCVKIKQGRHPANSCEK